MPLRILLATTFIALVVAEVMSFPGMFAHMAKESAEFREARVSSAWSSSRGAR